MLTTVKKSSRVMKETNDCAVRAVSIATGRPYRTVHKHFCANGRKRRKATPFHVTLNTLNDLGFTLRYFKTKAKTVRSLEKDPPPGVYLIRVRNHMLCLRDGKVHDWTSGRLHRIIFMYKVVDENI